MAVSKAISPGDLGTFVVDVEQLEVASSFCSDTAVPVTGVTYEGGCFFSHGHWPTPFSTESFSAIASPLVFSFRGTHLESLLL